MCKGDILIQPHRAVTAGTQPVSNKDSEPLQNPPLPPPSHMEDAETEVTGI